MVGVPNKNKCLPCRRRKIKCDGATPSCTQCRQSVINCEWEATPFINSTLSIRPGVGSAATISPSSPLRSHSWAHPSLIAEFVDNCIPGGSRQCTLTWLRNTQAMMKDSEAIHLALSALATGWVGRVELRPDLVNKGLQMYGAAAHQFGREIPKSAPSRTLVTTTILIMYELFEFGSGGNNSCWTYHLSGAAASMRSLEPGDRAISPYSNILSLLQAAFMVHGFQAKNTPLAVPLAISNSSDSSPKSGFQGLVDLGIETACLLREADGIYERRRLPLPTLMHLNQLLKKLSEWREAWGPAQQSGPLPAKSPPATTSSGDAGQTPSSGLRAFPRRVTPSDLGLYDNLHDTRLMRIYWTIRLTILMAILGNQDRWVQLCDAEEFRFNMAYDGCWWEQTQVLALIQEADEAARYICCHFDTVCRSLWPTLGDMLEIWSLETATYWYKEYAHEFTYVNSNIASPQPDLEHCRSLLGEIRLQMGYVDTPPP